MAMPGWYDIVRPRDAVRSHASAAFQEISYVLVVNTL